MTYDVHVIDDRLMAVSAGLSLLGAALMARDLRRRYRMVLGDKASATEVASDDWQAPDAAGAKAGSLDLDDEIPF